jgi:hypothetical protein
MSEETALPECAKDDPRYLDPDAGPAFTVGFFFQLWSAWTWLGGCLSKGDSPPSAHPQSWPGFVVGLISSLYEGVRDGRLLLKRWESTIIQERQFHEFEFNGDYYPTACHAALEFAEVLLQEIWTAVDTQDPFEVGCPMPAFEEGLFLARYGALCEHFRDVELLEDSKIYTCLRHEFEAMKRRLTDRLGSRSTEEEALYLPAKDLLNPSGYPADFKALNRALHENPWIRTDRPMSKRTGQPIKNRLKVHIVDWRKHLAQQKQSAPDPLDLPDHIIEAAIEGIERRKVEERNRKAGS